MQKRPYLCVFCGSRVGSRPAFADSARRVGALIAKNGLGLVYGGGQVGLMGMVADAALQAGAPVIGVIPEVLATSEVAHHGLTELHIVRGMHERKALMASLSSGFLTLPGGIGTFEEFFEILTWSALQIHQKPMGLLNVDGYFDPLLAFMNHSVEAGFLRKGHLEPLVISEDLEGMIASFADRARSTADTPIDIGLT